MLHPVNQSRRTHDLTGQGEPVGVWALGALVLLAIFVAYARLAPEETYNVSREGIAGGLSRIVVELNFPIALVAIAITLVALSALSAAAWWAGGPGATPSRPR